MLKKFFLSAAITALLFTGCDSDSSTAPSSTVKEDRSVKEALDKKEQKDVGSYDEDEGDCVVKKLSANSFSMTMKESGVTTKITSTFVGDRVENEYYTTYAESVPMSSIQSWCEENKEEAKTKNATVTCSGRTMTIKEIEEAYLTFEDALISAKRTCNQIDDTDEDEPDSLEIITPEEDHPAVCSSRKTETSFVMRAEDQDSVRFEATAEYEGGLYTFVIELEFASKVSMSDIEEACDDLQVMYSEGADESESVQVVCNNRMIMVSGREVTDENPISKIAANLSDFCNEIDLTGEFPY